MLILDYSDPSPSRVYHMEVMKAMVTIHSRGPDYFRVHCSVLYDGVTQNRVAN